MKNKAHIYIILTIGLITYLLLESFVNTILYINSFLFANILEIDIVLIWIILYLTVIFGEWILFRSNFFKEQYKIYCLIFIIAVCRLFSQFYIDAALYLLTNLMVFISSLFFFIEIFIIFRKRDFLPDFQVILSGMILGIGINFAFYIINISSNLSSELTKLPFTIALTAFLVYINIQLFRPNTQEKFQIDIEEAKHNSQQKNIPLFYFFFIGILFFLTISWILSPVTLSAYDILNLSSNSLTTSLPINWVSYGFMYYIFVILITAVISFFVIRKLLSRANQKLLKIVLLSTNVVACALNCVAFFIIEQDLTLISTYYLTILVICSILTILLDISFLLHHYSFSDRKKVYKGFLVFFFTLFFSIVLETVISWGLHSSFLFSVIIFSSLYFPFFSLIGLRKITMTIREKIHISNRNKQHGALFSLILILNGFCFGFILATRHITPPPAGNPTFMVWNIHNAVGVDDKFDLDRIIDVIKANDPDIVGLNEVDLGAVKTSLVDLVSYIAHKLNMYYYYGSTFYKHYGNAIFSKYPILEAENFALPFVVEAPEPRAILKTIITINSANWTVYLTHLSTKHEDRLAQVDYNYSNSAVSIINRSTFTRVVWMGDFNFEPTDEEYGKLNLSEVIKFRDTYPFLNPDLGYTGGFDDTANPTKRIDYILCSPDLTPNESRVICSLGSDHCAVLTKF